MRNRSKKGAQAPTSYFIQVVLYKIYLTKYILLGGGTHALHGSTSPLLPPTSTPAPPPPSASPHLNLKGLVFNFIKKIALAALSFFLLRIFFSRTKSFMDIDTSCIIQDIFNKLYNTRYIIQDICNKLYYTRYI